MGMDQKWKFLLQIKDLKEESQVGWELLSWPRWEFSINGLWLRKNMKNMELFKFKRDYDLLEYDLNLNKFTDEYKNQNGFIKMSF